MQLPVATKPSRPADEIAAFVLVHGFGGISDAIDLCARDLNSFGLTAFILYSFSARGVTDTIAD